MRKRKGFTLAELITAVAILAILAGFISVIFKSSIDGYRSAGANTEIMQKLRAITEQLNTDFEGLCKDGYLIIRKDMHTDRLVDEKNPDETENVYMDRIYYFTTGDFQSWVGPDVKSNIARIFWGHSSESLDESVPLEDRVPLSECRLARGVLLLTPGLATTPPDDCNSLSFAQCKTDLLVLEDYNDLLAGSIELSDVNNFGSFMCENIGEFRIEWTYGSLVLDPVTNTWLIKWLPNFTGDKKYDWNPDGQKPKALKFTFTLYDSKGILEGGRRFSHIVYLGD